MREIKFRAWLKIWDEDKQIKGKMFYQILPTDEFKTWMIAFDDDYKYNGDFTVGKDIKLMQYTGLKDKNKVKIYERDILKGTGIDNSIRVWEALGLENFHHWQETEDLIDENNDIEIIGNIYESKHLLDNTDTKV